MPRTAVRTLNDPAAVAAGTPTIIEERETGHGSTLFLEGSGSSHSGSIQVSLDGTTWIKPTQWDGTVDITFTQAIDESFVLVGEWKQIRINMSAHTDGNLVATLLPRLE